MRTANVFYGDIDISEWVTAELYQVVVFGGYAHNFQVQVVNMLDLKVILINYEITGRHFVNIFSYL